MSTQLLVDLTDNQVWQAPIGRVSEHCERFTYDNQNINKQFTYNVKTQTIVTDNPFFNLYI